MPLTLAGPVACRGRAGLSDAGDKRLYVPHQVRILSPILDNFESGWTPFVIRINGMRSQRLLLRCLIPLVSGMLCYQPIRMSPLPPRYEECHLHPNWLHFTFHDRKHHVACFASCSMFSLNISP
ncbi:hypothetical protein FNV43_RR20897 [Rhamnella rubrinervis]|uniref:Uncharacterized protein n=1 Tax=Rhamnella rubrinervis TaxID=2594499 RepID=A0A8K0DWU2_9ROSA|nr:hypothetical protein FNV43_RR20897 [Rhamnella rubrinervis]